MSASRASCSVIPAKSRRESRRGGPTYSTSRAGEGTGSPRVSNVATREDVMPGAESVRVPSRSKRMQVQVRVTVAATVGVGFVITVLWYVRFLRIGSAPAERSLDVRARDHHGLLVARV